MNHFEAELGLCRGGESLARSGEDDQPLAFRKRQQLIDVVQVALRQMRKRGAEDEPQPTSGVLLPWAPSRCSGGAGRGGDDLGPDHGQQLEGTFAIAPQDHGAEGQEIMGLTVAKDDLLHAGADRDRKDRKKEERQDAALTIVTATGPPIEPAGEPDRQQDEISGRCKPCLLPKTTAVILTYVDLYL